jgi:hypothetical protein
LKIDSRLISLVIGLCLTIPAPGCGPDPTTSGDIQLKIRYATSRHAQTDAGGLPLDVQSYQVQARAGAIDGIPLGDTGCVDVSGESERQSAYFDMNPHENAVIVASGYEAPNCSGNADWLGVATGVSVVEGEDVVVPIYVTRRGLKINDTRSELASPRAFSTATPLPDGRVLIAGGFDKATAKPGGVELDAACNAVIYHPGTATFGGPIPLKAGCRGFHQALTLMDGKVMLVGGTGRISIHYGTEISIVPSWEDVVSTADLFDPEDEEFSLVGPAVELQRIDPAAVTLVGMTEVVLMGGRTSQLRSSEIIGASQAGVDNWDWDVQSAQLSTARSGARAVVIDDGILLAGGNAWGDGQALSLLNANNFGSIPLILSVEAPAVTGHSLTRFDGQSAIMAGGVADYPGARPVDTTVQVFIDGSSQTAREVSLDHSRAYHAAAYLPDDGLLLAGGLDEDFTARKDLGVLAPSGICMVLNETLSTGSIGLAAAPLPDDSVLLAGGLDIQSGTATLSGVAQVLSP